MHITKIKTMLAGTLNIEPPWKIEDAEFDPEHKQIHIYVGIDEKAEHLCPHSGSAARRYGYEPRKGFGVTPTVFSTNASSTADAPGLFALIAVFTS